ncbi:DUF4342 domain-containing protein [Clostridium botulinum C]|uniref:DUF4342 domain-containing protein n=5 Tax=Clostridium TaxID=1485 RepID=A0A9Q4THK9_CLOBO|nr:MULTISPECIES: DUF4342 domain-containing protein [Clostridium]EGO87522.1 ubiquitin [Clostridium botulinum C str. Stockholm]AYF54520.1 DUF4342 domain-containing protein [Clostridium novyi]EES91236.1 UBA/TS-N domain containing protein [Clostridium botulinum D str. 1873]KEI08596.1 ubiquitin [Clostridium sp. K25]KEI15051.1 ubiquitin [Clostridium haemolyticum NCTC 9693]
MSDITLEKIDILRERTGVSYTEAKEALEKCDGNVVDSLIYLENTIQENKSSIREDIYSTKEDFMKWIKDIAKKGNVNRIRVKKDEKVIVDIPVNAGVAAGVIAAMYPLVIILGVVGAVVTKVTVEIVKDDGSVEVVNKIIKNTAKDVKHKVNDITDDVKEKVGSMAFDVKEKFDKDINKTSNTSSEDKNIYKYTVKFEEVDDKESEENKNDR